MKTSAIQENAFEFEDKDGNKWIGKLRGGPIDYSISLCRRTSSFAEFGIKEAWAYIYSIDLRDLLPKRKGIGANIYKRIEKFCLQNKVTKIIGKIKIRDEDPYPFWEKMGFKKCTEQESIFELSNTTYLKYDIVKELLKKNSKIKNKIKLPQSAWRSSRCS